FCYPTVSVSLYRSPNCGVNLGRGVLLHAGQDLAIEVEGNPDARMAEALLRHLGKIAAGRRSAAGFARSDKDAILDVLASQLTVYANERRRIGDPRARRSAADQRSREVSSRGEA